MTEEVAIGRAESGFGGGWLINHLPAILWQRRWYVIVPFVLLSLIGVVTAFMLPTLYRSSATLLVESQDLPTSIVDAPGTGEIEKRIAKIREQVLSRGDLISLIEQNDLYPSERRSRPMSYVVDKMRTATMIGALASNIGQAGTSRDTTIAITMSYDYSEPAKAQAVMQSYVTQFLRMDSDEVEDQANLTVQFLTEQAARLRTQIQEIEGQITALKSSNGVLLSGAGVPAFMDTGNYSAQITTLENENRQLARTGMAGGGASQLAQAEAALATAQATYSDSHPDVIAARERVAILKRAEQNAGATIDSVAQEQIRANNEVIAQLKAARDGVVAKANAAAANQARMPAIMEQASQLDYQANNLREQYKTVAANLMRAQGSARLANEQRAERLSLVEPPNMPDQPHWPNRPIMIAGGAVAGLGLGLVLALLVELLNRPMRSPAQVQSMGLPVLGVVPILQRLPRKKRFWPFRKREASIA
jgi:uncharacterized protein involved in exopolysaccharide biosynthesis